MSTTQLPSKAAVGELAAELEQHRVNVMAAHEGDAANWRSSDAARKENCQLLGIFAKKLRRLNSWLVMIVGGESSLARGSAEAIRDLAAWQTAHDAWLQSEPQPPVADGQLPADLPARVQSGFTARHADWLDQAGGLMNYWREVRVFLDRVQTDL